MLYLVSTPIGNLADMSWRAVETLKNCQLILCEDTRHSKLLLERYDISTSLASYHKFSECEKLEWAISQLKAGSDVALISDAGTPCISDPGNLLVRACHDQGITVSHLSGACAMLSALVVSGFDATPFQFVGFLPKKHNELIRSMARILAYPGASVCYESPQRIAKTLQLVHELAPERKLCLCRELSKKFEQVIIGTPQHVLSAWLASAMKGELVLVFAEGKTEAEPEKLSVSDHVQQVIDDFYLSKKDAIKLVAEMRGIPKREVYESYHR